VLRPLAAVLLLASGCQSMGRAPRRRRPNAPGWWESLDPNTSGGARATRSSSCA